MSPTSSLPLLIKDVWGAQNRLISTDQPIDSFTSNRDVDDESVLISDHYQTVNSICANVHPSHLSWQFKVTLNSIAFLTADPNQSLVSYEPIRALNEPISLMS